MANTFNLSSDSKKYPFGGSGNFSTYFDKLFGLLGKNNITKSKLIKLSCLMCLNNKIKMYRETEIDIIG